MSQPGHTHRDRRRRTRLVVASAMPRCLPDWRLIPSWIDGWRMGLYAGDRLRDLFPAFFAEHVAGKTVTTSRMLGVAHAFLELAHRDILTLDLEYHCPIELATDQDLAELVDDYRDEGGILDTLAYELGVWLSSPPIRVYGLEHRLGLAPCGGGILAHALWLMAVSTSWSIASTSQILRALPSGSQRRRLRELPQLPPTMDMNLLCDACAWSCDLAGVDGPWRLGAIVRYVFSQVHNVYADVSPEELHADAVDYGIFGGAGERWDGIWHSPHLAVERAWQQGARRLRQIYAALDAAVSARPALLGEIIQALARDAQALGAVTRPATLMTAFVRAEESPDMLLERGRALIAAAERTEVPA